MLSAHSSPLRPNDASGIQTAGAWIPAAIILATLLACALARVAELGPTPPRPPTRARPSASARRGPIELAGSGSNVPLTRALARAWSASRPERSIVVHSSVGSGGGLRALRDGAVDLAMVSRPLRASELRGVRAVRYAITEVILAANPGVSPQSISPRELVEVLRGERLRWSDGAPLRFIAREAGDSSHLALAAAVQGFAAAEDTALRGRRFMMVTSDDALRDALVETPGALGVTDLGGAQMHRRPLLRVPLAGPDGAPSPAITKDLTLVFALAPRPEVADFVAFVRSSEGREVVRASGYLAPEGP